MAKELPYFKFEPAEYLTKNISFCSLSAQGLFSNICCYYWQRGCSITKDQILRRLNYPNELQELISEGIIDLNGENISIKFLDKQLESAIEISLKNSQNGSKGGRPKKQEESEKKPTALFSESETKAIRRDKIREEEIKKDDILLEKETKKKTTKKNNIFIAPTLKEVILYFQEKGYNQEIATKAFNYYDGADWKDRNNNQVLNWKSKMQNNWFKDEYKIKEESEKIEYVTFRDQSFVKDEKDRQSFEKMKIAMAGGGYVFTELKSEWR